MAINWWNGLAPHSPSIAPTSTGSIALQDNDTLAGSQVYWQEPRAQSPVAGNLTWLFPLNPPQSVVRYLEVSLGK